MSGRTSRAIHRLMSIATAVVLLAGAVRAVEPVPEGFTPLFDVRTWAN